MGSAGKNGGDLWKVESLRLTLFSSTNAPAIDSSQLWDRLVGAPAENKIERPRDAIFRLDGLVDMARVMLSVVPGRVDLVFTVDAKPELELDTVPTMGLLSEKLDPFLARAKKLIELNPAIARLAFGAILIHPVRERREGYVNLSRYLHDIKIDVDNSKDFSYQINRPRPSSALVGININRLSKWGVILAQSLSIQIGAPNIPQLGPGFHGMRLELDISTEAERTEALPGEKCQPLLDELVSMGLEISDKGDIP